MAVLVPIAASPPHQELLMLEQRRRRAAEPRTPLGVDDRVVRRDLEIPTDDQIPDQRQVQLTGSRFTKRLHFGCEAKLYQRHIGCVRHINLIDAFLIIGRHIQISATHTASAVPFRIGVFHVPLPHRH